MAGETTEPDVLDAPEVEDIVDDVLDDEADNLEAGDGEQEPADEEMVEIEIDGRKETIPARLKDQFMFHADYTRKTQELAEQRRALDARIAAAEQAGEAEVNARARMTALDAALSQYQQVNWDALEAQDPLSAQRHFRTFMQLQQQRGEVEAEFGEARQAREVEAQRVAAEQVDQGIAELQRDIPDWGPAKAEALLSFGEKQFGFSRDFMEGVTDPKLVKLLHAAFVAMNPATKPTQSANAPTIRPAAKVKGSSAPPPRGLSDDLSADEWARRRNAQVARKG